MLVQNQISVDRIDISVFLITKNIDFPPVPFVGWSVLDWFIVVCVNNNHGCIACGWHWIATATSFDIDIIPATAIISTASHDSIAKPVQCYVESYCLKPMQRFCSMRFWLSPLMQFTVIAIRYWVASLLSVLRRLQWRIGLFSRERNKDWG